MAYTDDEAEDLPEFVSNYFFEDDDDELISFAVLPIIWNTSETMRSLKKQIFIHGTTDDGLQSIYKPVKAWKFDLSGEKPEISVLSRDNNWMKLQKPRKSFENEIRTVLIAVNFLHLVKKTPQLNEKVIWNKLSRIFSSYEVRPSENDLVDCKAMIEEAMKRDELLTKSEYLMVFLGKKPQKRKRTEEDVLSKEKREFIVDGNDYADDTANASDELEDGSSEEEDGDEEPFDSVCCICDNGGNLLCCEGSCMRSFHATRKAAEEAESECVSLGFSEKEVKDMPNFKCRNCQYKLHQCFSCGQLGSSDNAEVFQCVNATCGYFYHPRCVAKLLHRDSEVAAKELQNKILAGESFTCPLHTCFSCKQPEDKSAPGLQMAVCRRCPMAYHEKCLPRKISFEENEEQGIIQRAWRGLLVDRILIYCLKHEIIDDLGTPERDHIKFPDDEKRRQSSAALRDSIPLKRKKPSVAETYQLGTAMESKRKAVMDSHSDRRKDPKFSKLKVPDTSRCLPIEKKSVLTKVGGSSFKAEDNKISAQQLEPIRPTKSDKRTEGELTKSSKPDVNKLVPQLDSDSEKRILALMKEASSIVTLDDIIDNHSKLISARTYKQRVERNKSITQGKVEASCAAVRAAIKKLDAGGTIEDAKAICEPKVLGQVAKWKNDLKVYLAPFLCGMRYTSYGRHFTKIDKLNEIVDKIHWYVNDGDTIVDFCCGANDFSWLMKQKLDKVGKKCSFKNYDLFRPKNDFSFEKRDWMTVQPRELPPGSQLIMGLNPPFGVKASLANQFIDKALQFKPKILILIVPPETKRLDEKKTPYDLIWEDAEKLSGKSFYLPGSVDVNEKQMEDWNVVAPVLFLWSHPDWTAKHNAIARKHGHLHGEGGNKLVHDSSFRKKKIDDTTKKQKINDAVVTEVADSTPQLSLSERAKQTAPSGITENFESRSAHNQKGETRASESQGNSKDNMMGSSRTRWHSEEKQQARRSVETAPEQNRWQSSPSNSDHRGRHSSYSTNPHHGAPRHSPINSRLSLEEGYSSIHQGAQSNAVEMGDHSYDQVDSASYEASHGRARPDRNQVGYYHERVDSYRQRETETYLSVMDRYTVDARPRSGEYASAYPREPECHSFNQLPQSEPELRYTAAYSMESSYSRMNYVPAMERYNLRLDEQNRARPARVDNVVLNMTHTAGVNPYTYQAPPPTYPGDHIRYGPVPFNRYPPL